MKTILVGINAKYIHSNLAIRYFQKYVKSKLDFDVEICEYTINQRLELILSEIYKQKPEVVGFSCYIWNYEYVKSLCVELKKVLPEAKIILGGPEVSYNPLEVINQTVCDFVISGEGEKPFAELIYSLLNDQDVCDIDGITYRKPNDEVIQNSALSVVGLDEIDFVYNDMSDLENRIIYYEASRGCPFNCQYCLSSSTHGVRFLSLERVYSDMNFFITKQVRQVKFVDRTFNCDKKYAMAIWRYLIENDNSITNFHFEIAAELIDDEIVALLKTARNGLFQFEIGIQSTNLQTLKAIKRVNDTQKLSDIINKLKANNNMHIHLDLIAGLPYEDYKSFENSFNYVYSLKPDQLQLGFLKLLKGSGLYDKRIEYSLKHTEYAPYEILSTNYLSFDDVLKLKCIEEMVELYYNSNRYILSIDYICKYYDSPFKMFEQLSEFYNAKGYHLLAHTKSDYFKILFEFYKSISVGNESEFIACCSYDIYSHEKAKNIPEWVDSTLNNNYRKQIYDFLDNPDNISYYLPQYLGFDTKQIIRQSHIQVFSLNPITQQECVTVILFNYKDCDLLGNAKKIDITKNIITNSDRL